MASPMVNLDGLCDQLRDVPCEDIFKLGASAAASEFSEWAEVGKDAYTPYRKYQANPHSSLWFSAACAAAIVHRNRFFRLYLHNKSSESKMSDELGWQPIKIVHVRWTRASWIGVQQSQSHLLERCLFSLS